MKSFQSHIARKVHTFPGKPGIPRPSFLRDIRHIYVCLEHVAFTSRCIGCKKFLGRNMFDETGSRGINHGDAEINIVSISEMSSL